MGFAFLWQRDFGAGGDELRCSYPGIGKIAFCLGLYFTGIEGCDGVKYTSREAFYSTLRRAFSARTIT
jgi:hypothetical protein